MASRWVRGPEKAFNDEQMLELAIFFYHSNCEEVNRGSRFRKVALRLQNLFDGGPGIVEGWIITAAEGAAIHERP